MNDSQKIFQSYNIAVAIQLLKQEGANTCMELQDIIKNFTHIWFTFILVTPK